MKSPPDRRKAEWSAPVIRSVADSNGPSTRGPTPQRFEFYHDLQCRSGLGDRLLDLWAAATIARLHDSEARLGVRWEPGLEHQGRVSHYASELFSIAQIGFVAEPPVGAMPVRKEFSHTERNEQGIIHLASDTRQILLRGGMIWGTNCPDQLHAELAFYQLDPSVPLACVIDTYRGVARDTAPAAIIAEALPHDLARRTGFHVRRGDKLVAEETAIDMSVATWGAIEQAGHLAIERCIESGEPIFLCSDDRAYREALLRDIRQKGGDVVTAPARPAHRRLPGYSALVDFFCLAGCAQIVQMTKHSTFSLAAALLGDRPLVNFYRAEIGVGIGSRLDIWRSAVRRLSRG